MRTNLADGKRSGLSSPETVRHGACCTKRVRRANMVDKKITQSVEDLATVYKTLCLDLPLAEAQRGLGIGGERETLDMAWKGYDAGGRLATAAIDANLYRTPLFGEVMARSLDRA